MKRIEIFFKACAAVLCVALACSLAGSCSVIEDRDGCPNWLTLDFSRCSGIASEASDSLWWEGGQAAESFVLAESGYERTYVVRRGAVSVLAWMNAGSLGVSGGKSRIAQGHQSPELWVFSCDTLAEGEETRVVVRPHKRFCRLRVVFPSFDRGDSLFRAVVTSTSCGEYLGTGSAVKGDFSFSPVIGADGEFGLRLPVQGFGDLSLAVYGADGSLACSYDLSAVLSERGYDWSAMDLADVTVSLILGGADVSVTVGDWYDGGDVIPDSDRR